MRKFAFIFILFFAVLIAGCSKGDCECSWVGAPTPAPVTVTGKVVNPLLPGNPGVEGIEVTFASKTLAQKSLTDSSGNFSLEIPGNSNITLNFIKHNYYAPPIDINTGSGGSMVIDDVNASVLLWADMTEISYFVSTLFTFPNGYNDSHFVISPDGNHMYIAAYMMDFSLYQVMCFDINTNELTLVAGAETTNVIEPEKPVAGDKASFAYITDIEISSDGDVIYLTDIYRNESYVRKIVEFNNATNPSDVMVYTIHKYSTSNAELFNKLEVTPDEKTLYVTMQQSNTSILKITNVKNAEKPTDTFASTFAVQDNQKPLVGSLANVGFWGAHDLEITPDGDTLYVSDNYSIRKITGINTVDPQVVLLVGGSLFLQGQEGIGSDVVTANARLALTDDDDTMFYFQQSETRHPIKKLTGIKDAKDADKTNVTIITREEHGTQDGDMTSASFGRICDIALNSQNTILYFIDNYNQQAPYKIRSIVAKEK